MKKILFFAGLLGLLANSGCLVAEGGGHGRGYHEGHGEVRVVGPPVVVVHPEPVVVRPPVLVVRPPEVIVR